MRILLVWPTPTKEVKVLLDTLQEAGHEIVYYVGEHPVAHLCPKGAIFHDHYDAWDGREATARAGRSYVASKELIERMYEVESVALTMMNKRYDAASVDERKHVYYSMLAYWSAVVEELKPDAVVFASIPHSVYNYVLFELAKRKGLKTLSFEDTWVARRLLVYHDFWAGSAKLRKVMKDIEKGSLPPFGEEMQEYWDAQESSRSRVAPPYMALQKSTAVGFGLWRHRVRIALRALLSGELFGLLFRYAQRIGKDNLRRAYARVAQEPDWQKPFVYFPLHLQPERTTSPQGGVYHDQVLVAETIAAALPEGWKLYIKEHPSQWWVRGKERFSSARYKTYYERLARIQNARLVPVSTDTFTLTDRAKAVAVITGTVGWEAILRGKLPLVFGLPWYREYPGLFHVDSVASCRKALKEIEAGAGTSKEDVRRFLAALEKGTIRGYLENPLEVKPRYTPEQNARMIGKAIVEELKS